MEPITLYLRNAERDAVAAFNAGVNAHAAGNLDAAKLLWREAWDGSRAVTPAGRNLLALHLDAGEYAEAATLSAELLEHDPFDADLWVRTASLHRRLGRYELARDAYLRAIALHPYFRYWHDELAEVYALLGCPDDAARQRERGLGLDADTVELAYDDAMVHLRDGRYPIAAACAEAILEEFPGHTEARLLLASAHARGGDTVEALTALDDAIETAQPPASHRLRFERALLLADTQPERAAEDLALVLAAEPAFGRGRALAELLNMTPPPVASTPAADATQPLLSDRRLATFAGAGFGSDIPRLLLPDPKLPWQRRAEHLLRQLLAVPSASGMRGRVALVVEPTATATPLVVELVGLLMQPDFQMNEAGERPRLYWLESDETGSTFAHAGWLGSPELPQIQPHGWSAASPGIALDAALEHLHDAGGGEGFHLILFIGSGRISDAGSDVAKRVRGMTVAQMGHLGGPSSQLRDRLGSIAPNWADLPTD